MITGIEEVDASRLRILHTSSPSTSGSIRSRTMRSGCSSRATAIARAPSLAKMGVNPASRSLKPRTSSASGSSSTTRIFVFIGLHARMPDVDRLVNVNDLLGHVGGVICDPLQAFGYDHRSEERRVGKECRS